MRIFLGAIAALLLTGAASAQTTTSTSTTGSAAQAGAGASSGAAIYQTFQGPPPQQRIITEQQGASTQTIRNTPSLQMPGIFSGSPCTVGGAAGGAGPGLGISLGISYNDDDCELRMRAAMMLQAGQAELAKEMLCAHRATRVAYKNIGQPCSADRPVVAQQPAQAQQVATQVDLPPKPPVPGWCYTLTSDEKRRYAATCTP